jgi:ATP-binding cassette subfamily C protein
VSFTLTPGQHVALVGASGSGKSTLAKLVCGLYEPWQGEILFDGRPRAQVPPPVLHYTVAMVDQDIVLFAGTVRENLTLWDSTIPDGQLIRACTDAAIHDVVLSLPAGYDGELLEGAANLSGGQRQRLEIARALVYDPTVLVLGEATSALDAETEYCPPPQHAPTGGPHLRHSRWSHRTTRDLRRTGAASGTLCAAHDPPGSIMQTTPTA